MRCGILGEIGSSPNSRCASFIQQIKMFHAFPTEDFRRLNVPTTLNQTMVPFTLSNNTVQHLEPGENKEGMAYCLWEKDCFEALLQRHSLCKFGITRVSVTSEGVLISTGLQLSSFIPP